MKEIRYLKMLISNQCMELKDYNKMLCKSKNLDKVLNENKNLKNEVKILMKTLEKIIM